MAGVSVNLAIAATALTLQAAEALTYYAGRDGGVARRRTFKVLLALGVTGAMAGAALVLCADVIGYSAESRPALLVVACALPVVLVLTAVRGLAAGIQLWRRIAAERLLTSLMRLAAFVGLWATDLLNVTSAVAVITLSTVLGLGCSR